MKTVTAIYDEAIEKLTDVWTLHFGPSHIVWEDSNFGTHTIKWCLENGITDYIKEAYSAEDINIAMQTMRDLLEIPEEERERQGEEYYNR